MLQYHCDLCGVGLPTAAPPATASGEPGLGHHTVEIRITAPQQSLTEEDLHEDALESLADLLALEQAGQLPQAVDEPAEQTHRYDLCPDCHARYRRDPLGVGWRNRILFSEN